MQVVSNASSMKVAAGTRDARRQGAGIALPMTIPQMAPVVDRAHFIKPASGHVICHAAQVAVESPPAAPAAEAEPAPEDPTSTASYEKAIMLQGFAWDSSDQPGWYKQVQSKIPDMQAAGITHIWLPPPSESVAPQGYMPGQLYNLESKYGNEGELKELVKALNDAGIVPMCDIVINHRCADEQHDGVWNKYRDDVDHGNKKVDWGRWAITSDDPKFNGSGNPDTGADFEGAPDLDHTNPELRGAIKDWLNWLKNDIGFKGWRFDFSKGYGAEFVKEYIEASTAGAFNVGEYWTDLNWDGGNLNYDQNGPRQTLVDWVNGTGKLSTAFDFPTKGILQEAVKNCQYSRLRDGDGKPSGGIGWLCSRMVTFVDNHDTGSTQQHWPFPDEFTALGNAYILTHPGIPCIFWDHIMRHNARDSILKLIELRKRNELSSRSKLEILAADDDMYVARIDDRVMIKMGPRGDMGDLTPNKEEGWKTAVNGKDFAVWEKTA